MKKILLGILGVLGVGVIVIAAAASMQPDTMHCERSILVAATPADVYPYANDFTKWQQWNPWGALDPNQKLTFSENKVGVGAWYEWKGNDDVGSGRMEITESVQDQKVVEALHFVEPFESKAVVTFSMAAEGEKTKVTWGFDSEQAFPSKVFALFADMDAMLGKDFQRGLDTLKPLAEAEATRRIEAERVAAEAAAAAAAPVDPTASAAGTVLAGSGEAGGPAK